MGYGLVQVSSTSKCKMMTSAKEKHKRLVLLPAVNKVYGGGQNGPFCSKQSHCFPFSVIKPLDKTSVKVFNFLHAMKTCDMNAKCSF